MQDVDHRSLIAALTAEQRRVLLEQSDATRLDALTAMFMRYGNGQLEAVTRARVLYYMQVGYDFAELNEAPAFRLSLVPHYLFVFTGQHPAPEEIEEFNAYATTQWSATTSPDTERQT